MQLTVEFVSEKDSNTKKKRVLLSGNYYLTLHFDLKVCPLDNLSVEDN